MKRLLLILLCVPLMFSCGEKKEENNTENTEKHEENDTEKNDTGCVDGDCENGQGTYIYANGSEIKYVGEFKDGKFHGKGTYTYCFLGYKDECEKYIGEWQEGKKNGYGEEVSRFNEYKGEWKDGKYHEKGTWTMEKGDKYVGEFKDGEFHGKGTYTRFDEVEEGLFENGEFIGEE